MNKPARRKKRDCPAKKCSAAETGSTITAALPCPNCDRTFRARIGLISHIRTHRLHATDHLRRMDEQSYSSCAVAALVWLLLIPTFFSFLKCTLVIVSAEFLLLILLFPRTLLHVLVHISLICCHCVSMSMFHSSRRSCSASYLFLIVSLKVSVFLWEVHIVLFWRFS